MEDIQRPHVGEKLASAQIQPFAAGMGAYDVLGMVTMLQGNMQMLILQVFK